MLEFHSVTFAYGKKEIFRDFSMSVADGEILAVMGPSGCGKTTLLSLAAGLKKPKEGSITSTFEKIAYVFQEPRLFPWLTVKENLEAVLEAPQEKAAEIKSVLDTVGLQDSAHLYPHELSGGMKSRVSLARAMLFDGDLYLLDEPFSALDEELRDTLSELLKSFFKKKNASAILVTHQQDDARKLADRILYLDAIPSPKAD
ncbi:MAG: ABC transporter ATP-binding protein [Ruminococcaceae bacterium]|nr:ABC transporter ATP-binding protein [Oscillospiraceae bacterium]